MNSTGKFLVSALLVHAANLKQTGSSQRAPKPTIPSQPQKPEHPASAAK